VKRGLFAEKGYLRWTREADGKKNSGEEAGRPQKRKNKKKKTLAAGGGIRDGKVPTGRKTRSTQFPVKTSTRRGAPGGGSVLGSERRDRFEREREFGRCF